MSSLPDLLLQGFFFDRDQMPDAYQSLILPDLCQMLEEEDLTGLAAFCGVVHPAAIAEIIEELDDHQVWKILDQAELPVRVEIFEYIPLRRQTELVQSLDSARLSALLEWMSADDRVDLLERMPEANREEALRLIAKAERQDVRRLLSYSDDSAGSIMTTEYASLPANITVREAIAQLRQQAPNSETIYYVYILSESRRLEGFISLRDLILARSDAVLADIMQRDVIRFRVTDRPELVAQEIARYNFIALPIVDEDDRLVGIVTHDDALDVVQEEATEDAYLQGAVAPLRDTYEETTLPVILWKRGVWLLFLSLVALMNAHVIDHYRGATDRGATDPGVMVPVDLAGLSTMIMLFLPLVMASGGNAGSQSATLFIRMFALQPSDSSGGPAGGLPGALIFREFLIGLSLGLTLASLDFAVAWLWFGRSLRESGAIATTVIAVVVLGTSIGTLLPLFLRRLGQDPAIMSNPLIAATLDIMAVIIFYEIATGFLL